MRSRRSSLPSLPTGQATIAGGTVREAMTSLSDPTPNLPYSLSFSNWIEFSTVMLVSIILAKYSTYIVIISPLRVSMSQGCSTGLQCVWEDKLESASNNNPSWDIWSKEELANSGSAAG